MCGPQTEVDCRGMSQTMLTVSRLLNPVIGVNSFRASHSWVAFVLTYDELDGRLHYLSNY